MYRKIKILVCLGIFMLGTFVLHAQTEDPIKPKREGEIVMTKSELISFLEKIAQAKKEKVEQDLEHSDSQYTRSTYNVNRAYAPAAVVAPFASNAPVASMSRNELLREIDALNARMNAMYGYGGGGTGSSTTFLTTPGGGGQSGYYPYQQQQTPIITGIPYAAPDNNTGELRWKIDSLQRQVSMLSAPSAVVEPSAMEEPSTLEEPSALLEKEEEISRLNKEIIHIQDSLIAAFALIPEAKEIEKGYGVSEIKVFFDNNMSNVSAQYSSEIENAAMVLKENPQLRVVLKGFASPAGNAKYNYELSMRRNESVKRLLIEYGVLPDQISSVFYGEDKISSSADARRVEIKFISK